MNHWVEPFKIGFFYHVFSQKHCHCHSQDTFLNLLYFLHCVLFFSCNSMIYQIKINSVVNIIHVTAWFWKYICIICISQTNCAVIVSSFFFNCPVYPLYFRISARCIVISCMCVSVGTECYTGWVCLPVSANEWQPAQDVQQQQIQVCAFLFVHYNLAYVGNSLKVDNLFFFILLN